MAAAPGLGRSELGEALRACRNAFIGVGIMSCMINLLYLTGSIFMLEVYDRVLPSRSEETLLALTLLVAALYALMGILDYARTRIAARIGATMQARLDARVFNATLRRSILSSERSKPASGLKDLESVQKLMGSPVLFAVFDMPWAPVYIFAIFTFHPWLGYLSIGGGLILVAVTIRPSWHAGR